jgi:hypothetical protein
MLAALLAVAVNGLIRTVTMGLVEVSSEFRPFTWPQLTLFTVLGVAGATFVYAWLLRRARRPAEAFRKIALIVLAISIVPDIGLLLTRAVPGITPATFAALVLMHVTTAMINIRLVSGCPHIFQRA